MYLKIEDTNVTCISSLYWSMRLFIVTLYTFSFSYYFLVCVYIFLLCLWKFYKLQFWCTQVAKSWVSPFSSAQCKGTKCLRSGEHRVRHGAASRFPSKSDFCPLLSSRAPSPGEVQPPAASFLFSPSSCSGFTPLTQGTGFIVPYWFLKSFVFTL